jgi:DNA-binding response OmpR family regulator
MTQETQTLRFLIIDDCPSRYDEFTRMLDREGHRWMITCDPGFVEGILECHIKADSILLDHDMPHRDGRKWARWLTQEWEPCPIIITSTTGLEGVREEMLETLRKGGFKAIINPADHIGCETEWLSWMKGALA